MACSLSIIIPTCGRQNLLEQAIISVLKVMRETSFEIIVVPNGESKAWQSLVEKYTKHKNLRWLPIVTANACAARNHGLKNAVGKYVRFLDDDDYLLPAAKKQLEFIIENKLDICSAPLECRSESGEFIFKYKLPDTNDFVTAVIFSIYISGLTQGSIFKRSKISNIRWREGIILYDDYLWMIDVSAGADIFWEKTDDAVAVYVQHDSSRLSRVQRNYNNCKYLVDSILWLFEHLKTSGKLSGEHSFAISSALLTIAHSTFPASPIFLHYVIKQARIIDSNAAPLQPLFKKSPYLIRNILLIQWLILPIRICTRLYRRVKWFSLRLLSYLRL